MLIRITRIIISLLLTYLSYRETGIFTSIIFFLILMKIEFDTSINEIRKSRIEKSTKKFKKGSK